MRWSVFSEPFLNAELIFPTQQRDVKIVIDSLSKYREVKAIIIFGSSVTPLCNPWSDIDIFIECAEGFHRPPIHTEAPLDIWTSDMVDEDLLSEILSKGVLVYEQ